MGEKYSNQEIPEELLQRVEIAREGVYQLPNYVGTGDLIERLLKKSPLDAPNILLRDDQGRQITDLGESHYRVARYLALTYHILGEHTENLSELTKKIYQVISTTGIETLLGKGEQKSHEPIKVPGIMPGFKVSQKTPYGSLHLHITHNPREDYRPLETFLQLGHAGGREAAHTEALGRLSSYILRTGGEIQDILNQLGNISSKDGFLTNEGVVPTVESGFVRGLIKFELIREHLKMDKFLTGLFDYGEVEKALAYYFRTTELEPLLKLKANANPIKEDMPTSPLKEVENQDRRILGEEVKINKIPATYDVRNNNLEGLERCPECGTKTLIHESGCNNCLTCGYSDCGGTSLPINK